MYSPRDCTWASFQISWILETHIRGCQNSFFSNTQDILNILKPRPGVGRPNAFPWCPGTGRLATNGSAIRFPQPGDVRPGIGWPIAFPGATGYPEVTQPGASTWNDYDGMPKREQRGASSSSGRNGSLPVAQASEERLQSSLEEDDDIRNLLSTGVELNPVFLKRK